MRSIACAYSTTLCLLALCAAAPEANASIIDITGVARAGDFDGDDKLEIAVSSPETDCGKGAVYVVTYKGALTTWNRWGRDKPGVLGMAACDDLFGASLAVGDFNGDGYDDLAISTPGADDTAYSESGSVNVLYGSEDGLTTDGDQLWTLDTSGVTGEAAVDDYFSDALAAGDFNCDGYDDLAIGGPRKDDGVFNILYGTSTGLSSVDDLQVEGSGGHFGAVLVAGNFNGDEVSDVGCDDLIVAAPHLTVSGENNAGALYRFAGDDGGLASSATQSLDQNSTDIVDDAEDDDLFGWRLGVANLNDDAYDDLLVAVPGDACTDVGTGLHRIFGSEDGLVADDNTLSCDTYGCSVLENLNLACHSGSAPVYGRAVADVISLGFSNGVAWGGDGGDDLIGDFGDDLLFGGAGDDWLVGGPGRDMIIAGDGDDTIVVDLDCTVKDGEVIDGGPGDDTIRSHRTQTELEGLGLTVVSIENFVTIDENADATCDPPPADDGPYLRPPVKLSWDNLATPDAVLTSSSGLLSLQLENTSAYSVAVTVEFILRVRGAELHLEQGPQTVTAATTSSMNLDLNDFIPGGIDPNNVNPALLVLPISASLSTRAQLTIGEAHVGYNFAPTIFGHLETEEENTIAVLYREGAYHDTYHHGDLSRWRADATPYSGTAKIMGRIEAHGSLGIPGY